MKKVLLLGVVVLFSIGIIGITSCDDEVKDAVSCAQLALDVYSAQSAYESDNSTANCIAYRDLIIEWFDECNDIDATVKASYQLILNGLTCD